MRLRSLFLIILLAPVPPMAQTRSQIDCKHNHALCEIEIGGQTLVFGMSKEHTLELLARSSLHLTEDRIWSAEHKPDSLYHLTVPERQPFAGVIKGGVKFRGEKLDGAMVIWSPESNEQSDFAASLINLLERFSNEGSTSCTLSTRKTTQPQQEERSATFQCGMRSVSISHERFQLSFQGQKISDNTEIYEFFCQLVSRNASTIHREEVNGERRPDAKSWPQ
jgi:hypothetical protein